MKVLILNLLMITSIYAAHETRPQFSAFSDGENIHITFLGDKCNYYHAELNVEPLCQKNRLTRNFAVKCSAELNIAGTELYCGDDLEPRVTTLKIKDTDIAPEAQTLTLKQGSEVINIVLKNHY